MQTAGRSESEQLAQQGLRHAMNIASDLGRIPSQKRLQVLIRSAEDLTKTLRKLYEVSR